jgi:ABC-2 type transport system permease protein
MNARVRTVIRKEFREYRRNKLIVFTMAGLPIMFLVIMAGATFAIPDDASAALIEGLVGQVLLFFLLIPVILPTTVAAYTVIGEKEQGTLEPVLSTPATDRDLLLGKALAAVAPAVLMSWALFVIYGLLARAFAPHLVVDRTWSPEQVTAQILVVPALAVFAILVGMLISLRSSDIRVAQQLAALATLPVIGVLALTSYDVIHPSIPVFVGAAVVIAVVDLAGWMLTVRLFDRERVLTRFGG